MSSNVFPFRRRTDDERNPPTPVTEEGRARFAHKQLTQIKHQMEQVPVIKSSQRIRVANNLWKILSGLERGSQPLSKREVLHAAGKGTEGDSTKRLPYYAIDPALPEAEQLKRASRLTQKIRKYVDIARAAARLTQREDDHFIPALVEGTQYAISGDLRLITSDEEVAAEAWREIAATIDESARGLAQTYGLKEVFESITAAGTHFGFPFFEGRTETFRSTQNMPRPALVSRGEVVPCPSLSLDVIVACERIPCELRHEGGIGISKEGDADLEAIRDALLEEGADSICLSCYAEPYLRVFLELLPHGIDGAVIPSFRLYPGMNIVLAEDFDPCKQIQFDEDKYGSNRLKADDGAGEVWQPLQEVIQIEESLNTECIIMANEADAEGSRNYLYRDFLPTVHFDEAAIEMYRSSLHARFPKSGSLIVSLDDTALEYLTEQLYAVMPRPSQPFCGCVEYRLSQLKKEVERVESIAGDSTLLAALDRSLSDELGPARLDKLLEQAVNEFMTRANEAMEKHRENIVAKDKRTSMAFRNLRERRARFATEYKD